MSANGYVIVNQSSSLGYECMRKWECRRFGEM